jgi:hypothetical protein
LIDAAAQAANLGLYGFQQDAMTRSAGQLSAQSIVKKTVVESAATHMANRRYETAAILLE